MPHKGPHISISPTYVVNRILRLNINEFEEWPEAVQALAVVIAQELFLVAYNPFVDAETVRTSVNARFEKDSISLSHHYANSIGEGITMFWSAYNAEMEFRKTLIDRLEDILPDECILRSPGALVETATDATDLRMELPLLVVEPDTTEQVAELVRLANELKFSLIPRGGGSGLTGGAVPARKRTLIVSLTRLTKIGPIDLENMSITCQAGCITQQVIDAASQAGALFSIDPASKQASSIGGNVSENAGGPYCFEYGTTIDNLLWWRMVTPTGEIITVERENHPRHKILPDEMAVFSVKDVSGGTRSVVHLKGTEIRLPGLGKDVTNKALGGLPGMQKEGVDGIITEACFVLHPKPKFKRIMVLEFFGRSMQPAAVVVRELVALRNRIREEGDYAHLSALEEFNAKYVQAIDYKRKSERYEGTPISVILLQVDGDDPQLLDSCVKDIVDVVEKQDNVDIIVARDEKEGEVFWEDRHKLSAIAKRTSGFKLNEDVVIPMQRIPEWAKFLEQLNIEATGAAYRYALQDIERLPGFPLADAALNREFLYATQAATGEITTDDVSDEEIFRRAVAFCDELCQQYPNIAKKIAAIRDYMDRSRIVVASHMHAGDGNCHVNIPVNSNDAHMLEEAEKTAMRVMGEAQKMGGEVSGEHGIGITKIAFLAQEKMVALQHFKKRVDPRDVMNPGKLVQRELPVRPFTFSFNRLINDIRQSGLAGKELLIDLLSTIQVCTRCGKCKLVCGMHYAERSMQFQPRNKNMILGMLLEAIYYSQVNKASINSDLLAELRDLVEHCTGCGRCTANCPVKIPSADVALSLRALLEREGAGGHPIKEHILNWLTNNPEKRIPQAAKAASFGQKMQNKFLSCVPEIIKSRMQSPAFSGKGPKMGYKNLYESLKMNRGTIFSPAEPQSGTPAVLYFPGCGGALFYDRIGMASVLLMLRAGWTVVVPPKHLCCGYALLAAGMEDRFKSNMKQLRQTLADTIAHAQDLGLDVQHLVTACGSCRAALKDSGLAEQFPNITQKDVGQLVMPVLKDRIAYPAAEGSEVVYHASCHAEWADVHAIKGRKQLAAAVTACTGVKLQLNPGCCAESGMGSVTSPAIYNLLRERKRINLEEAFADGYEGPVLVGCPSCKIGIGRNLLRMHDKRSVLHLNEWLATLTDGEDWRTEFRRKVNATRGEVRVIQL